MQELAAAVMAAIPPTNVIETMTREFKQEWVDVLNALAKAYHTDHGLAFEHIHDVHLKRGDVEVSVYVAESGVCERKVRSVLPHLHVDSNIVECPDEHGNIWTTLGVYAYSGYTIAGIGIHVMS